MLGPLSLIQAILAQTIPRSLRWPSAFSYSFGPGLRGVGFRRRCKPTRFASATMNHRCACQKMTRVGPGHANGVSYLTSLTSSGASLCAVSATMRRKARVVRDGAKPLELRNP